MTNYVCGAAFNKDASKIALIRKTKPEWQEGCLNFIGGKIEHYDGSPAVAQAREFFEETGVTTKPQDWTEYCVLGDDNNYKLFIFKLFTDDILNVETTTEETVHIFDTASIPFAECISNIAWLVPMALETRADRKGKSPKYDIIDITEEEKQPLSLEDDEDTPMPITSEPSILSNPAISDYIQRVTSSMVTETFSSYLQYDNFRTATT